MSSFGWSCGWEECYDTINLKPDPDREDSKLPFPSPPSPASALVRKSMKNDALEPIYDTVLVLIDPPSLVLDGIVNAETDAGAHDRMNDLTGPHSLESWSVGGRNVKTPVRGNRGRARQKAPFGVFEMILRRLAMAMWMRTSSTCKIRREGTVGEKHDMSGMLMLVVRMVFAKLSIGDPADSGTGGMRNIVLVRLGEC